MTMNIWFINFYLLVILELQNLSLNLNPIFTVFDSFTNSKASVFPSQVHRYLFTWAISIRLYE